MSPSPDSPPPAPVDMPALLQQLLDEAVSPFVRTLGLSLVSSSPQEVVLDLPITPLLVHSGQVLCGQAMLAAADTVMVLAITAHLGQYRRMSTVQLQTSFLRPVPGSQTEPAGSTRVVGRVLRAGRNLVFGEIELLGSTGRLAAHSTTTYALL